MSLLDWSTIGVVGIFIYVIGCTVIGYRRDRRAVNKRLEEIRQTAWRDQFDRICPPLDDSTRG